MSASEETTVEGSERIFERVAEHFSVPKGALDFARALVVGVGSPPPRVARA